MTLSNALKLRAFEATTYREFLRLLLKEFHAHRGYKKRLADSAGCQPAYFSQVMAGQAHLTPEQADRLCAFWELTPIESEFFFNLVLLGRAGSQTLKHRLERKIKELRSAIQTEQESFGVDALTEPERAAIYYSHWLHSAIHLLLTVPGLQTAEALAMHLHRSEEDVLALLEELARTGLIEQRGKSWKVTSGQIHAPQRDFFAEVHHKNWRAQAIEVKNSGHESFVRYTSVHSISKADAQKIKDLIEDAIDKSRLVIEPSPEEMCACLLVDYFSF